MTNVLKIIHFSDPAKLFFSKVCYKVNFKITKKRIYYENFYEHNQFSVSMFVSGTLEILFVITNKKNISSWGWYMAFGILVILCCIGIIWQPSLGALSLVYTIAYTLLIIGIFLIMLSFEPRSLHKRNYRKAVRDSSF